MAKPNIPTRRIVAAYAGWWIFWTAGQTYLVNQLGFDLSIALPDAAVTQLVLAFAGYAVNSSMHYYNPSQKNSLYVLSWGVALAILCMFLQRWILGQWFEGRTAYLRFLNQTTPIRGLFDWFMITLIAILTWFWVYINEQHEIEKRNEDAERLAREAELSNLRQQLQPHFLFNSLNSISALVSSKPEQARIMIQQLSDFLRGTVKRDDRQFITLAEELQHLQLYLDIEKVRFGHRLVTLVECDDASLSLKLPSLLLQPLVENAIKFGLYDTVGEITISLQARSENHHMIITITNPFDPATAQPRPGTGFGLNSVRRRLYLLYSQQDLLQTDQKGTTFITLLKIPQYP